MDTSRSASTGRLVFAGNSNRTLASYESIPHDTSVFALCCFGME